MGSTSHKNSAQLVSVGLDKLKQQLNVLYADRNNLPRLGNKAILEHLWDLKESAILEGRGSVDVPESWLNELNDELSKSTDARGH
ncbi:MAG: hypothetical protein IAF58_14320 [Leptolyngbya sp.]|nr:hypothetical protein [Candidatus Melainabacteria bacterium]